MPLWCKQTEHNPEQFQVCNPIAPKSGCWALWAEGNWNLEGPVKYLISAMFSIGWAAGRNEEGRKAGGDKVRTRRLISYAKSCPPHWTLIPTGIWSSLLFVWYFPCHSLFHTLLSNLLDHLHTPWTCCSSTAVGFLPHIRELESNWCFEDISSWAPDGRMIFCCLTKSSWFLPWNSRLRYISKVLLRY